MKIFLAAAAFILILPFFAEKEAHAKQTMAFGYLANKSTDVNFNYLETIFPNSFATSLMNIFDVNVIKPHAVNEILTKHNLTLKKDYAPYELSEVTGKIRADIFVYGDFIPLSNNRLKIVLNFYTAGSDRLFTFTNIGKMETEIFKLVDRIAGIIINYMDKGKSYKIKEPGPGAKIAIITNLDHDDLNLLYIPFMEKGYAVSGLQGNTLHNLVDDNLINNLQTIYTKDNSFNIITDIKNVMFKEGTWGNEKYSRIVNEQKGIYRKYDLEYEKTKTDLLNRLKAASNGNIEYILIIGFNTGRNRAWIRCIDVNSQDLIWMQENIKSGGIMDMGNKIIEEMVRPVSFTSIEKGVKKK